MKLRAIKALVVLLLGFVAYRWLVRGEQRVTKPAAARQPNWFDALLEAVFSRVNRWIPWHQLPTWLGVFNLIAFRNKLRAQNLYDASRLLETSVPQKCAVEDLVARRSDGKFNDLDYPEMGSTGQPFGRNVPLRHTSPDPYLDTPNPRVISNELLARREFIPAKSLNLLAAAWIQFQTHDWFDHGSPDRDRVHKVDLPPDDPLKGNAEMDPMQFPTTPVDPQLNPDPGKPRVYRNQLSHWWDASAIYGSTPETTLALRTDPKTKAILPDGKLYLPNDRLPVDPKTRRVRTGHVSNWWLGLALLHTLFAREHNAVCDCLRREYPTWTGDRIFNTTRLIIAALTAKIHTTEWTTAILAHPVLRIAMKANWWGLATEAVHKLVGRLSESESISGIPGSNPDHHGAPFALTEEFVSVYRLHPLIPDLFSLYSIKDGRPLRENMKFQQIAFDEAQNVVKNEEEPDLTPGPKPARAAQSSAASDATMEDAFYSFGIAHPGAITLQNYPDFLRDLTIPQTSQEPPRRLDLAATDIFRDRERGVPRFNQFRELLHLPRIKSFAELTPNKQLAEKIRQVYNNDIDSVDLMVGLFAENPPKGFGFSDTAFRVFILMASRRLKSDRFFTTDYRPEIYSKAGLEWIAENDMSSVLLRHYPTLAPSLRGVQNAFAPWNHVS
jgi:Animal haem peroxidase